MENLPAHKNQYDNWPESLRQVQLAREGEFFKDIDNSKIIALLKQIANEHDCEIGDDNTANRVVAWLKSHFPHLRPKQFDLAFQLYDAKKLHEKYLKLRPFKVFTKDFIGNVLDGFREYNQSKMKEVISLENKEAGKDSMTSDQRASSVFKILKEGGVDIKMHTDELKKKDELERRKRAEENQKFAKHIMSVHENKEKKKGKK